MKYKLSILIAVLISIAPVYYFIYAGVDLRDYLFSIVRATIIFAIITLTFSALIFFVGKKIARSISYLNAYNISGILQIIFIVSAAIYMTNSEVKGFESIRSGDERNYEFSGKEYYLDTGELKKKITVKVRDGKGDSVVIHYSKSGQILDEKIYKVDR